MSTGYNHTYFIDGRTECRAFTAVNAALMVEPDGAYTPGSVSFQIGSDLSPAERAQVAERFAEAVTSWATELRARADGDWDAANAIAAARKKGGA
ncbi:hypothetical protein ADL32_18855 [Streptomyces albidoflavus]|uniref:hypothetical protein n=1 Tax=Streptomyces albidoflavus TaxID=1886 RepID=UPI0007437ADE|nr:hypothetical protein [Streptomyces albidoflavus]KUL59632.1 hypothetical protein ADL32_18855 [Streptomyces albidoflavus]